jgi:hypothetical protein
MYNQMLADKVIAGQENVRRFAQNSLTAIERNSATYQADTLRNGEPQPMLIIRMQEHECRITAMQGGEVFVGDMIDCFSEKWLVMEAYTDEHGVRFAKAWLCNHLFKFQNHTPDIIERWGVLDDGRYISHNEKRLPLEDAFHRVYLPFDEDTQKLHIDKRLALGTTFNENQRQILQVGKIVWADNVSSKGLLKLRLDKDVYSRQTDNIDLQICDYLEGDGGT